MLTVEGFRWQRRLDVQLAAWLEPGPKKVVLGDGAVWIWNLAGQHFPSAIQIVDLYHARAHLWELSPQAVSQPGTRTQAVAVCLALLEQGNIEALVKIL